MTDNKSNIIKAGVLGVEVVVRQETTPAGKCYHVFEVWRARKTKDGVDYTHDLRFRDVPTVVFLLAMMWSRIAFGDEDHEG